MDVPRIRLAARLVPWLRSWRTGLVSLDDLVEAMTGEGMTGVDQNVVVDASPDLAVGLQSGLAVLSTVPPDAIRLLLPVPGDVRGLPRQGPFSQAALEAHEAVLAGELGVVGRRLTHTSGSGDTWDTVTWRIFDLPEATPEPEVVSVGEADLALTEALREATKTLSDLDVASWSANNGRSLKGVRTASGRQLPAGFDGRTRLLYARALLLDRALAVAESDAMGGAVNSYEAGARLAALRPLATACRQAICAACNARLSC